MFESLFFKAYNTYVITHLLPEIHYSLPLSQVGQLRMHVLHTAPEQLEGRNTNVGLLFIDFLFFFSTAFYTIFPTKQCLGHSMCARVYDFPSGGGKTRTTPPFLLRTQAQHRDAPSVLCSVVSPLMTVSSNLPAARHLY